MKKLQTPKMLAAGKCPARTNSTQPQTSKSKVQLNLPYKRIQTTWDISSLSSSLQFAPFVARASQHQHTLPYNVRSCKRILQRPWLVWQLRWVCRRGDMVMVGGRWLFERWDVWERVRILWSTSNDGARDHWEANLHVSAEDLPGHELRLFDYIVGFVHLCFVCVR